MRTFEEYVPPSYLTTLVQIRIPADKMRRIIEFSRDVVEAKKMEDHHRKDFRGSEKRFVTGTLGEAAIEEYFGIEFIDWSVGESRLYAVGDLGKLGINCGSKCVTYGDFHVIERNPKRPEILSFRMPDDSISLCGFASTSLLKRCYDNDVVRDKNMLDRKTGFWGYKYLVPFSNLQDIRNYTNGISWIERP